MIEKVYVETSVIGAYFDERTDIVSAAQKYWTRIWWDELRNRYEVVVSRAVVDELKHLALASYHKCYYLLTWNCKHIANPNKSKHATPA